jgi:hypothetical protein
MKRHSGWLAAGLLLFTVIACNLSKNNNNSNNSNSNNSNSNRNKNSSTQTNRPASADVYVDKIRMAKDDAGDPEKTGTSTFGSDDLTIHCVINLNKARKGTAVKFSWRVIDVPGQPQGEFKSIDYSTNSFENIVHGHLTRTTPWPKGTYEVVVDINGFHDKVIGFTVE